MYTFSENHTVFTEYLDHPSAKPLVKTEYLFLKSIYSFNNILGCISKLTIFDLPIFFQL